MKAVVGFISRVAFKGSEMIGIQTTGNEFGWAVSQLSRGIFLPRKIHDRDLDSR